MPDVVVRYLPSIVIVNFLLVSSLLLLLGRLATARPLKEVPEGIQNAAEFMLGWFVDQARRIHPGSVALIASFLASLFLVILFSNLLGILPIPLLRIPPTSYYSGPLALALIAVLGGIVIGARVRGVGAALKHLLWPNPLQLVAEVSHVLSLSLRLYGNIGGEVIVARLAAQAAPYGVPLVIHTLGLIPVSVQPLIFTVLTANFLATAFQSAPRAGAQPAQAAPELEGRDSIAIPRTP